MRSNTCDGTRDLSSKRSGGVGCTSGDVRCSGGHTASHVKETTDGSSAHASGSGGVDGAADDGLDVLVDLCCGLSGGETQRIESFGLKAEGCDSGRAIEFEAVDNWAEDGSNDGKTCKSAKHIFKLAGMDAPWIELKLTSSVHEADTRS